METYIKKSMDNQKEVTLGVQENIKAKLNGGYNKKSKKIGKAMFVEHKIRSKFDKKKNKISMSNLLIFKRKQNKGRQG